MRPQLQAFFDQRTFTLTYLVWDEATRDALAIDAVLDYEPAGAYTWTESIDQVSTFVREKGLRLHYSLETHAHADATTGREDFVQLRTERDQGLAAPKLLFPSVQLNVSAGRPPGPRANGIRHLATPLNFLRKADDLGEPVVTR